jgi:DnaJ-class molecular chaperone
MERYGVCETCLGTGNGPVKHLDCGSCEGTGFGGSIDDLLNPLRIAKKNHYKELTRKGHAYESAIRTFEISLQRYKQR